MPLGQLPGRLIRGAGRFAGKVLENTFTGGYEAPAAGTKYQTMNPREEYRRGLRRDVANTFNKRGSSDFANAYAERAEEYNRTGPERLRAQKRQQVKDALSQLQTQAAQRTSRMGGESDKLYQRYAQAQGAAGKQPLPQEAWEAQLGMKPGGQPASVQAARFYQQLPGEGEPPKFFPDGTQMPTKREFQESNVAAAGLSRPGLAATITGQESERKYETTYAGAQGTIDQAFDAFMGDQYYDMAAQLDELDLVLKDYESGKYDKTSGLIVGRISPFTTEQGARQQYRMIMNTLIALQITNLAPVTENEIALLTQLSESPARLTAANIGILKEAMAKLKRGMKKAEDRDAYFQEKGTLKGYRRGGAKADSEELADPGGIR